MAIRGVRKDIAINPVGNKAGDPSEVFVPEHIELRNGTVTHNKNWMRRNGYDVAFNIAENSPVSLLIDQGVGFAVTENGKIFRLDTLAQLSVQLQGKFTDEPYYPTFAKHKEWILICDGGVPVKISTTTNDSSVLSDAPNGKYIARIGNRTVISGYEDAEGEFTEFSWCALDTPLNWTTGDSGFASIRKDGEALRMMRSSGQYLYFFKERNTEVWALVGGATTFQRHESASFNVGILAGNSLVLSLSSFVWIGHTGDVYELVGTTPRIISIKYKQAFDDLFGYTDLVGFDFYREYKIRWFSSRHGKTFVYDYQHKIWSEENTWQNGWSRLPFNSQMYFNNRCYVGSFIPNGQIYEFSRDILDDNGVAIRTLRQYKVEPFKEVSDAGMISKARFRLKRGETATSGTPSLLELRCKVDNGSWLAPKYLDLGANYDKNPFVDVHLNLFGSQFEFQLVETGAVEYLVTGMEVTLKPQGARAA